VVGGCRAANQSATAPGYKCRNASSSSVVSRARKRQPRRSVGALFSGRNCLSSVNLRDLSQLNRGYGAQRNRFAVRRVPQIKSLTRPPHEHLREDKFPVRCAQRKINCRIGNRGNHDAESKASRPVEKTIH